MSVEKDRNRVSDKSAAENEMSTLNVDGAPIRVFRSGKGESRVIVYLPSILGEVCSVPFVSALASAGDRAASVFVPEYPGCGGSKKPVQPWRSIEDAVFHFGRVLDAFTTGPVTLLGSSLGGWIAAEIAAWFPSKINALVLANPFGLYHQDAPIVNMFDVDGTTDLKGTFNRLLNPNDIDLRAIVTPSLDPATAEDTHALFIHLLRVQELCATIGWNPLMHDPSLEHRLNRVDCPTLILWGEKDGLLSAAYADLYAKSIPGAKLQPLPNLGHLPFLEDPVHCAATVETFLRDS
jgi:pimeloyl-ACP methyl ester carboxylesterase